MAGTSTAGTNLSREILGEVLDERGKPGSDPEQQATTFAEQVQDVIDSGADLDWIRRRVNLSESELRDSCSDLIDDGFDEDWSGSGTGY